MAFKAVSIDDHPLMRLVFGRALQQTGKKHLDLGMVRRGKAMEADAEAEMPESSPQKPTG
jgi:hypothetical protein